MPSSTALKVLSALQLRILSRNDDDCADRLHYLLAPAVLLSMAGLHGLKQYFGRPVECWPPAEMAREHWLNYIHGFCFVENTYFVGFNERFPIRRVDRDHRQLHFYQWVPFILMAQALLLILPKAIWFLFIQKNGFGVSFLFDKMAKIGKAHGNDISREITTAEEFAVRIAKDRRDQLCFRRGIQLKMEAEESKAGDGPKSTSKNAFSMLAWWLNDQKFTFGYIGFKLANLAVVLLQLHLLNSYFGPDDGQLSSPWALNALANLSAGRESPHFPRVTFCDLLVRPPQRDLKPLRLTFQCLLNMNTLNEKIFLFVPFALFALAFVGCLNLALWLHRCFSWRSAEQFVRDELLKLKNDDANPSETDFHELVKYSLGRDTVTLLHIVNANCPPLTSAKMIGQLWHYHKKGPIKIAPKNFFN
ncbi:hypothetical protein niasHS_015031 [Heterodera schachtii]|uniref:Innexin n=1 Tax=Heterodera schachtii TaxID=97005 RepID=A0ABD2I9T0_HETSC